MQASKIIPNEIYALEIGKDQFVRYRVAKVVTVQTRQGRTTSPHDYVSHVVGWVHRSDIPDGVALNLKEESSEVSGSGAESLLYRAHPEKILGPYQQVAELKEKADREREERKKQEEAQRAAALAVRNKFYRLAGVDAPPLPSDHRRFDSGFFRVDGYGGIAIEPKGVVALYRALLGAKEEAA